MYYKLFSLTNMLRITFMVIIKKSINLFKKIMKLKYIILIHSLTKFRILSH